ncbi:MAG: hypothetical protein QGH60_09035 [Phycisphaerae bacterium]|jgi:hypothetical protein|nr:hypothetical protein [Phycisphaerae bacterium]
MRAARYDAGQELTYEITGVSDGAAGKVRLDIDKFVGGGFAGQVYRVNILEIDSDAESPGGLEAGKKYAMKILVPPSRGSLAFRNLIYRIGFQGPFQLQVNPAAARAGALWQKFIRLAAGLKFGDERSVVDIHATFVDRTIGSCGELSEWIDGRVWDFEVDNHLDVLKQHLKGGQVDPEQLGSPEYRAKHRFMGDFVKLLHEIGAHEFARQYEWATCKSQPNVLKRNDAGDGPEAGLTAVDFRAGLALLPFLPMSPGDFALIAKGVARGSLVQFDRGNLQTLERYVDAHRETFADMGPALEELKAVEEIYRNSVPDITHNHVRLLYSGKLWSTMIDSAIGAYHVRGITDDEFTASLRRNRFKALLFAAAGMIGAVCFGGAVAAFIWACVAGVMSWPLGIALVAVAMIAPRIGRALRAIWGNATYRKHCWSIATSPAYAIRAFKGKFLEKLISWHRDGRVSSDKAVALAGSPLRLAGHAVLSFLPVFLHRMLTDLHYVREKLFYIFVRPARLYFNAEAREQWLRDMMEEGRRNGMLSEEDHATIEAQISEPFIQKYLKSLAVHVCTLPISQVVALIVAAWYCVANGIPFTEAWKVGLAALAVVQVVPISPGSLVRGLYVVYLAVRERNFKDYNIALFLGFVKYLGYLSFPIQMAYRYPALARFMAGHWATGAVHAVPVFGEHGALLEHAVFGRFYNWPLTIRRRMKTISEHRKSLPARGWQILPVAVAGMVIFALSEWVCLQIWGSLPGIMDLWPVLIVLPMLTGAAVTKWAGSATLTKRALYALICGLITGLGAAAAHITMHLSQKAPVTLGAIFTGLADNSIYGVFLFGLLAVVGAIIYEIKQPLPDDQ